MGFAVVERRNEQEGWSALAKGTEQGMMYALGRGRQTGAG